MGKDIRGDHGRLGYLGRGFSGYEQTRQALKLEPEKESGENMEPSVLEEHDWKQRKYCLYEQCLGVLEIRVRQCHYEEMQERNLKQ